MSKETRMPPPEWAPQKALMIGWPSHPVPWEDPFEEARKEVAALANLILSAEPLNGLPKTEVILIVDGEVAESAAREMVPDAQIINTPCGDTWVRDTGPILRATKDGMIANCFGFNGWGEKYIFPGDEDLSDRVADALKAEIIAHDFILEGGSIDWDGEGAMLTTRECLINPNRNPAWDEAAAERALENALGATDLIWITNGLLNDHTDGHIDNLVRFVAPRKVVCQMPNGTDDPHAERLLAIKDELDTFRFRDGGRLEVVTLPSPGRVVDEDGEAIPASHMNFVITNQAVIIPAYTDEVTKAADILKELFPNRNVLHSPAGAILTGGGSFHCISQQVPEYTGENNA